MSPLAKWHSISCMANTAHMSLYTVSTHDDHWKYSTRVPRYPQLQRCFGFGPNAPDWALGVWNGCMCLPAVGETKRCRDGSPPGRWGQEWLRSGEPSSRGLAWSWGGSCPRSLWLEGRLALHGRRPLEAQGKWKKHCVWVQERKRELKILEEPQKRV